MLKYPIYLMLLFMAISYSSCFNSGNKDSVPKASKNLLFKLTNPKSGDTFKSGDTIRLSLNYEAGINLDSCIMSVDGKHFCSFNTDNHEIVTDGWRMGVRRVSIQVFANDTIRETLSMAVKILPHSSPKKYNYQVIREYPHDDKAYTQGLCYYDGFLYEGTGLLRSSSLRQVKLETGAVIRNLALDDQYFGEGICIFDNKILQLTWRNHIGFIYNLDDFSQQGSFTYPTEGWGLATDGKRIWMSDGSSNIYLLDSGTLEVLDQIEVYTPKGPVFNLNELEYINNEIWANVYGEDYIVRISPQTGEVLGVINLEGILKDRDRTPSTDVLNGIAYDSVGNRIFVTGKNWSRLFEIKLIENK